MRALYAAIPRKIFGGTMLEIMRLAPSRKEYALIGSSDYLAASYNSF